MKKLFYIALAVLATAALASCQQEKDTFKGHKVGENEIAFTMNSVSTRSMEYAPIVTTGESFKVGTNGNGEALFLEETIEELNPGPATKGAPAYTVNVGNLYPVLGVYADDLGDTTYELFGEDEGWHYYHNYPGRPWPENPNEKIDFYLRMPATMGGVSNLAYADKKIEFDFSPLSTAKDQEDLLFSQVSISKNDHYGHLSSGGVPVTMYHALTGVKFRVGNDNTGSTKTIITQVKFTGLKGSGHCVVDGSNITWTPGSSTAYTYTQTFTNPDYDPDLEEENPDGSVNFTKPAEGDAPFGDSWYTPGGDTNNPTNTKNLNLTDGSLTFWFIPQAMTDDVKLEVTFVIKTPDTYGATGGGEIKHTIEIGKTLAAQNVEWKAGQLRTYTLAPKEVDVEIEDTMSGLKKSNLHIANTGNVAEYVRMLVIGNWYGWESEESCDNGDEPSILVGYKTDGSNGPNDNEMAKPWFRGDSEYGSYFSPDFKLGVPTGTGWVRGDGGYYYPYPIGPGDEMHSGTTALFEYYEWPSGESFPTIYIPTNKSNVRTEAYGVHLIMEVVIQAIGSLKPDGTPYESCWKAWSAAMGTEVNPK